MMSVDPYRLEVHKDGVDSAILETFNLVSKGCAACNIIFYWNLDDGINEPFIMAAFYKSTNICPMDFILERIYQLQKTGFTFTVGIDGQNVTFRGNITYDFKNALEITKRFSKYTYAMMGHNKPGRCQFTGAEIFLPDHYFCDHIDLEGSEYDNIMSLNETDRISEADFQEVTNRDGPGTMYRICVKDYLKLKLDVGKNEASTHGRSTYRLVAITLCGLIWLKLMKIICRVC